MEGEGVANIEVNKTISGKEKSPEEIIPKDCWEKVFEKLNVEDLRSCRAVCKTFRRIADLSKFKVKWRFDQVLPILMPYLESNAPEARFSWENLHKIRLTCVAWRESVDKYATDNGVFKSPTSSSHPIPLITPFKSLEDLEEFQEKFGDCKTNPFPARTVYIQTCFCPDLEGMEDEAFDEMINERHEEYDELLKTFENKYIEKVGDLLQQFGRHIFKLHLQFALNEYIFGCSPLALCKFMKRITLHLPNLKELLIDNFGRGIDPEAQEVATYIRENQLAALPHLKTLWIGELDKEPENFLLNAFAPHLHAFAKFNSWDFGPLDQVHMQQFEHLRDLQLHFRPGDTLEEFQFLKSPLKILRVTCSFVWPDPHHLSWKVDKVLRNLRNLPIEFLDIELRGHLGGRVALAESDIPLEEYINKSVWILYFKICGDPNGRLEYQVSFNFLQAFKKLEELTIIFPPVPPTLAAQPDPSPQVDLFECMAAEKWQERISESNVWEKVPSLKILKVRRGDVETKISRMN